MKGTVEFEGEQDVEFLEHTYTVCFTAVAECEYQPGRTSGPPEYCYPEESELDINSVVITKVLDEDENEAVCTEEMKAELNERLNTEALEEAIWKAFLESE